MTFTSLTVSANLPGGQGELLCPLAWGGLMGTRLAPEWCVCPHSTPAGGDLGGGLCTLPEDPGRGGKCLL